MALDPTVLIDYVDQFSYAGIFVISLLSGHLIPFPEDVILLIAGYLSSAGFINPYYAIAAAILGILVGDNILYSLSKSDSKYIHKVREYVYRSRLLKREDIIRAHIRKAIFLSRFVPFFRTIGPVVAGTLKIRRSTFQLYNFLGMGVYVPVMVGIGYFFESKMTQLVAKVESVRHWIFIGLLVAIGIVAAYLGNRKIDRFLRETEGRGL